VASYYIWLSLQEWPFLLLEGDTVSHLCQVHRRTGRHSIMPGHVPIGFLVSLDFRSFDAAYDPGWSHSNADILRKQQSPEIFNRPVVWICTDETVSGLHYMDIPLWLPFSSKV